MSSPKKTKNIFFLVPYPAGTAPGQRFRFEQYLSLLTDKGHSIMVLPFLSSKVNQILYTKGNYTRKVVGVLVGFFTRLIHLPRILNGDYIFVFREAAPLGPPIFEWVITKLFRKRLIYDFDDAIWLPNTTSENRAASWLKCHGKVKSICQWSYKVSCGNAYLAEFARRFNTSTMVNPTTIDTEFLHNPKRFPFLQKKNDKAFVIGWTGTHSTLPYLQPLLPIIESLWKKYPMIALLVIADKNPAWAYPFLRFVNWSKDTEITELMKIDVGIMPLPDEPWAYGKCGFKALQYLSLEKPALVSPIGVNTKIVQHGETGYHCQSPEEWSQYIEYLIDNPHNLAIMGKKGRQYVQDHYSVDSNTSNFLSLFE